MVILIVFAKKWTQHQTRQFWPKRPRADPLDLELGFAFCEGLKDLTWRIEQLETWIDMQAPLTEYQD
jgi:hypothetical protein